MLQVTYFKLMLQLLWNKILSFYAPHPFLSTHDKLQGTSNIQLFEPYIISSSQFSQATTTCRSNKEIQ